jgi:ABC-type antimicrobial peptide transport system permease subunit
VRVGSADGQTARIVGVALLPATSHTDYDQSGWMTKAGLSRIAGSNDGAPAEDYVLVRWRPGTNVAAAQRRLVRIGGKDLFPIPAALPGAVADLGRIEDLPIALAAFFGLLACATVTHALVTTVRRRRHDLAVLRSIGFTRRQTRVAIAWQATLLALVGVVIGVPLGIAAGRFAWRWLADDFPLAYVPPLALLAVAIVVAVALAAANALAAGPAHVAARIRPADALRTE